MNSQDFEIFHDWGNTLKTNDKIQFRTIHAKAQDYLKTSSFAPSEIEEILIADGYKETLVKEALSVLTQPEMSESQIEAKVEAANGIPKKYADLAPRFEKVLTNKGANYFVKAMTSGESPLLKLSKKELETFQRIADLAYENPVHYATLHTYMKPSVTSELAENVCKARKIKNKCKIASDDSGFYKISHNDKIIKVSYKPIVSTSSKYQKSNYELFGFPDEYVILAYEANSPYAKLNKELAS
jgi:hypothetical protein